MAMAKKAVDLKLSRVNLMTECDRLAVLSSQVGARLRVKEPDDQPNRDGCHGQQRPCPLPHGDQSPDDPPERHRRIIFHNTMLASSAAIPLKNDLIHLKD
jgi:hypothetical protein